MGGQSWVPYVDGKGLTLQLSTLSGGETVPLQGSNGTYRAQVTVPQLPGTHQVGHGGDTGARSACVSSTLPLTIHGLSLSRQLTLVHRGRGRGFLTLERDIRVAPVPHHRPDTAVLVLQLAAPLALGLVLAVVVSLVQGRDRPARA
jgi:hypothetical protein